MIHVVTGVQTCALPIFSGACSRIEPGYAGIKVNLYGSEKGVDIEPLSTGRIWYNPITHDIYQFPTFMQSVTWTATKTEGSSNDDSITFNSVEGAVLNTDIAIAYRFRGEKVPELFMEFRQDAKSISWGYMRSQVRDAFGRHAGKMKAVDVFGERKQDLLTAVKDDLNQRLGSKGFDFDMISFVGAIRADDNVLASINAVIQAAQRAIEAENKVRQAQAEAQQAIATAEGRARSVLIEAESQAKANDLVAKSVTQELVQWQALQKWNGILPQVTGGAIPMIQVPQSK